MDISCYRLYEKDIADQPLIVDWYDGSAVAWAFARTRNVTPQDEAAWLEQVAEAIRTGLGVGPENLFLKQRRPQARRQEGDGQYQRLGQQGVVKIIREQGLRFEINCSDYLDTGLFLDHRPTRARVRAEAAGARVLNLFAYTGSFTCYACAGGARSTRTVDLSNTYLEWSARNLALNGVSVGESHALVRSDCLAWLAQSAPEEQVYDLIICDPPTFSNSTSMAHDFSIQRDHPWLLARCRERLAPGGILYFSTNFRGFELTTDLSGWSVEDLTEASIPEDFRDRRIHALWRLVRHG